MNQNPEQLGTPERTEAAEAAPQYPELVSAATMEDVDAAARKEGNRLTDEARKRLILYERK